MHAAKVDTHQNQSRTSLMVLTVVLESGERLPCLVNRETWIPVRVAMRWSVRYRRYRVQSSTLENNLRTIGRIYEWAESVGGFDLDDYLTNGKTFTARHIESMALHFRARGESPEARATSDPGVLDHQLSVAENFLKWALDSDNRGGVRTLTLEELSIHTASLHGAGVPVFADRLKTVSADSTSQ